MSDILSLTFINLPYLGFNRKEFRGKLAIAITANFINRNTQAEARVEEISGVAFIFNQKFFLDLKESTRIDLENIVYYKDDTHYFVMTAKKASLLEKGVLKEVNIFYSHCLLYFFYFLYLSIDGLTIEFEDQRTRFQILLFEEILHQSIENYVCLCEFEKLKLERKILIPHSLFLSLSFSLPLSLSFSV